MEIIFPKSGDQRKRKDVNSKGEGGGIPNKPSELISSTQNESTGGS